VNRRWLLILALAAAAGCAVPSRVDVPKVPSSTAAKLFDAHGISFQYPGNWVAFDAQQGPQQGSPQKSQDVVGLDDLNVLSITAQLTPSPEQHLSAWDGRVVSEFTDAFAQSGIEVRGGPDKILLGGKKGLQWKIRQPSGVGYVLDTTIVVILLGDTEYFVKCQHTTEREPEMDRGCAQAFGSFAFGTSTS